MGVTDDNQVNLGNGLCQHGGVILGQPVVNRGSLNFGEPGMNEQDDDVGTIFAKTY
ncbi:hypothetical protein D3C71_2166550 [compost metagenome]